MAIVLNTTARIMHLKAGIGGGSVMSVRLDPGLNEVADGDWGVLQKRSDHVKKLIDAGDIESGTPKAKAKAKTDEVKAATVKKAKPPTPMADAEKKDAKLTA